MEEIVQSRTDSGRADVLAALRGCRLWRDASSDGVGTLAAAARVRDVPRGGRLVSEGDPAEEFGVVVSGKVQVFHLGADGKRMLFETLETSDPIAAVAALAGGRYPANADASTPATIAWIPRKALWDLVEAEPQVARTVITDLARRVVDFTSVIQSFALDVPARLARYLFQRALAVGSPTPVGLEVDLGMSKSDLASALGTVPETLSRAFGRLRDDGIVEVQGRRVIVLDVRTLAEIGSGYTDA